MFNLRSLDLNLLTVFETIYELGSVTVASDRLALSQSATSHALTRLREACRDELFIRGRQGLSPTPVAKAMYPAIKQALETLRTSLADASVFDPAKSQRHFQISIPHPMGPFFILALRRAASKVAPRVVLRFDTVSRPIGLEDGVRDGIIDIAVDWLPITLKPFVNKKLFDDRLAIVVRCDHPRIGPRATIEELRKENFVGLHPRRQVEQRPLSLQRFARLGFRETVQVSELLEIPTVVAGTDLLGLFPASMGPILEKRLGLRIVLIPLDLPAIPIYVIWLEARRSDTGHRWMREFVTAELSNGATISV
jgi:LysR family transcriptional regulator, transcriptional activator for leuABCD operon